MTHHQGCTHLDQGETGLWTSCLWRIQLWGLTVSSGTQNSSPALGSAQTAINYPLPLIVPAQEVMGLQKTTRPCRLVLHCPVIHPSETSGFHPRLQLSNVSIPM